MSELIVSTSSARECFIKEDIKVSRRILCVYPEESADALFSFSHVYPLTAGIKASKLPQGLLVIAAYLPKNWQVRFVDENLHAVTESDFRWAEAVFVSGMHIHRQQMNDICRRAHAFALPVVLGGPSVSACPEHYPDFDYLHVGELGDATDELIHLLAESIERPPRQLVLITRNRVPMSDFPVPAYELAEPGKYLGATLQYSSGCPYECEFCDIPALYGRQPRLKTPQQIIAELDKIRDCGIAYSVYFVDDNFIGNRKAALALLPHLIEWQREHGYPVNFSCEATINIGKRPEILEMMREAGFDSMFCGIETPDPDALRKMQKDQNLMVPILEAVETINSYGIEVQSGIILGLDTDMPDTADAILEFIEKSRIPVLSIGILQALPRTPLWERLSREGRIVNDCSRDSNVQFLLPYEDVVASWRRCMATAFEPSKLFARFSYQCEYTYKNRLKLPSSHAQPSWKNIRQALVMLRNIFWRVGVLGPYRGEYWRFVFGRLRRGSLTGLLGPVMTSHQLIMHTRTVTRVGRIASPPLQDERPPG